MPFRARGPPRRSPVWGQNVCHGSAARERLQVADGARDSVVLGTRPNVGGGIFLGRLTELIRGIKTAYRRGRPF